eukprot:scaffold1514_cov118-Cylindrotheca_fusiformis.AAC.13
MEMLDAVGLVTDHTGRETVVGRNVVFICKPTVCLWHTPCAWPASPLAPCMRPGQQPLPLCKGQYDPIDGQSKKDEISGKYCLFNLQSKAAAVTRFRYVSNCQLLKSMKDK